MFQQMTAGHEPSFACPRSFPTENDSIGEVGAGGKENEK
jgi:hypothetical protein